MTPLSNALSESAPTNGFAEWRERLHTFACLAGATVLLITPHLYWLIVGARPTVYALPVAAGLLILILPFVRQLSIDTRSWVSSVLLIIVVGAVAVNFGFAPVFVGTYNLLLLTTGLLLGKRAMVLVTVVGVTGLVFGGIAVNGGTLEIDVTGRDPSDLQNWVRVTALFALLSLAVVAVVRYATRTVSEQYVRATQELARATQLREAAEKARESRLTRERELRGVQKLQAVAALSGGLAHLFNNALTVVQSVLESLQRDASKPNRARARDRLSAALAPALRATRDLMVFSRRETAEKRSVELAPMLAEFAETLGETVPEDVNLQIDATPGLTVLMSPEALKQLLLNLVLNAADATTGPGNVKITIAPFKQPNEQGASMAAIAVEDDGAGMDEVTLAQALDPFFTGRTEHSGLGLPVAHAIAGQAGGELRLESSVGVGTRALVLLPLEFPIMNVYPSALWPTESALHGTARLGSVYVPEVVADWSDEQRPQPIWQDDVARRLGRITAVILVGLVIGVSIIVPHMRPLLFVLGPPSVLLLAVAGWAPVPGQVARTCLITGFWLIGASVVFRAGFDNMAGMSIVLISIAWAAMLGGRWGGLVAVALTSLTLLVFGYLRSGPVYIPPASNSDMNLAANWFRFAPQLALYSLALSTSVLGALTALREGMESEQAAFARVEELRDREAEEGARMLALEASATRAERATAAGQAAGTIAHDLLNAVQSLLGTVDVLAIEEGADDQSAELLAGLIHAAGYAEALTTQFDSASPTQDVVGPFAVRNISTVSKSMSNLMRHVLPGRIRLVSDVEPDLAVRISETDFRRLVFNLVANARDAIYEEGTITLTLRSQDGRNVLCVTDDGCGMDESVKARIFNPFFSTKEQGRGTGLGLHSVNDVVQRTDGSIDVESTEGTGSSFTVSWPSEVDEFRSHGAATLTKTRAAGNGGVVLLAEDESLVREVMADAIREAGFDVVEATNGDDGKRLASENTHYVAACIDGVMPGAPSSEVIESFQQAHPRCPILLCSGYLPADLAERGLLKPGVTLLEKPFTPTRLKEELQLAIERSASREADGR